jgi:hypothetical protein
VWWLIRKGLWHHRSHFWLILRARPDMSFQASSWFDLGSPSPPSLSELEQKLIIRGSFLLCLVLLPNSIQLESLIRLGPGLCD